MFWGSARAAAVVLQALGLTDLKLRLLPSDAAAIVFYHNPSGGLFRRHMRFLKKRYNIVPLRHVVDHVRGEKQLPRNSLAITFDDGFKELYTEVYPVLQEEKVPATVFLVSDYLDTDTELWWILLRSVREAGEDVPDEQSLKDIPDEEKNRLLKELAEKYHVVGGDACLSSSEVRDMLSGGLVTVGSHTKTHPCLIRTGREKMADEIRGSKRDLEEMFGVGVDVLSYPNGDFNQEVVEAARKAGYRAALTVLPGRNPRGADPYRVRRFHADGEAGLALINLQCSGLSAVVGLDFIQERWHRRRGVGP